MRLVGQLVSPVEVFFDREDRRYGFLRPPDGSEAALHTGGEDVLFHLDDFYLPRAIPEGVKFDKQTPTPDQIRHAKSLAKRGYGVVFDLRRTSRGYRADPWCPQKLWDDAVKEWMRLNPHTQPNTRMAGEAVR